MDELKKFKHVLLPLGILFLLWYGLTAFSAKFEDKRLVLSNEISGIQKVVDVVASLDKERNKFKQSNSVLLSEDADQFLNRIGKYASETGVYIASSRKVAAGQRTARHGSRGGDQQDSISRDYAVELEINSDYDSIVKFVNKIDKVEKYIVVSSVDLVEQVRSRDDSQIGNSVSGVIVVKAKSIRNVQL